MEITNIIIFLLAASILFEIYLYKNSMKHLKSYKGLSKLTKMVSDINFNKEEKELFMVHIKSSINSSKNSFIFSLFFTIGILYFNHNSLLIITLCVVLLLVSLIKHIYIKRYTDELLDIYMKDIGEIKSWMDFLLF